MNAPTSGKAAAALADFIILNEELAALVRARLPLETHLRRFGAELPGKAGQLAELIGRRMEAGETLTVAMDAECATLPAAYRAAILAGVESGHLGSALESLVDSASRIDQLRRVTGIALIYPLIILIVACVLLSFVVSIVVPSFDWLDRSYFGPLAPLANEPLAVPMLAVVVPTVVMLSALLWWWRSGRLGGATPRFGFLARFPGTGSVRRWSETATFAEILRLLVERGLPLDQALRLAADTTNDPRLRSAAGMLAARIEQGGTARAVDKEATHDSDFPMLIRLALHHAGDRALLAGGLRHAATMYRERAVHAAEWYAEYLPMLLTVAIGGTITIGFTLMVLWPYAATLHELSGWNWK
jgi:type II secretory pathway component PulF